MADDLGVFGTVFCAEMRRHGRRKIAGNDGIHIDEVLREIRRQLLGELMDGRLARDIAVGCEILRPDAGDRSDIDDSRWILATPGSPQQREEQLDQFEGNVDIHRHDASPGLVGKRFDWGAPGLARIVDEDVEAPTILAIGSG